MTETDLGRLRQQLTTHEGLRLRPYVDTVGKLTIGVGRNLTDKGISYAEAMVLLDNDVDEVTSDLGAYGWFSPLDSVRQLALADLRFNLGPGRFRTFRKMLAALEAGNYEAAAAQLIDSAWAAQVQPSRRDRLYRMLRTGTEAA